MIYVFVLYLHIFSLFISYSEIQGGMVRVSPRGGWGEGFCYCYCYFILSLLCISWLLCVVHVSEYTQ